jgi:hypothetical protein
MKKMMERTKGKHWPIFGMHLQSHAAISHSFTLVMYREDVNIKEITVGDEQANVPESDEESEEGEVAEDEDMIEGEPEDEAADADKKRGYDEGDESSSLTPPKRKRRF